MTLSKKLNKKPYVDISILIPYYYINIVFFDWFLYFAFPAATFHILFS